MKRIIALFILIMVVGSAYGQYESMPYLDLTLLNQDPDPAAPGEYLELRFKIDNEGLATAQDAQVELLATYPFSIDPNEDPTRYLGDLESTGNGRYSYRTTFKVRVDEDAVEGTNKIRLRYRLGDSDWVTEEFDVEIQTVDATLSVESVLSSPERIKPGEQAKVAVKVKNMADSLMKDVTVRLDLTFSTYIEQVTTTTITDSLSVFDSLPFAPIGSATEKKIKSIRPDEEVIFTFDIIAYPSAEARVYKIPLQMTYYDELGESYTKNDVVGLVVGSFPDLSVTVDSTDIHVDKPRGEISVKFVNKGMSDIKFLSVKLEKSDDYEILSSDEVYLGNVDSDDYETADFDLYVKKEMSPELGDTSLTLPLQIEYKDATNKDYAVHIDLPFVLHDENKVNGNPGPSPLLILLIVIVVVGVYLYLRKRSKKKA